MAVFSSGRIRSSRAFFSSPYLWLVLILWLALGLRLFHLGSMSLWWDETLSYERARHDLATILSGAIQIQNVVTHDLHPPLYFLLLHYSIQAFGFSEFALRFLSTCFNLLTVALVFPVVILLARIARVRNRARIALLAAFFSALSPFYVWYSQEARPYAAVLFWSLLALYLLVKVVQTSRLRSTHSSNTTLHQTSAVTLDLRSTSLYLLAGAAMLATHYLSFVLLPFHAAALLIFGNRSRRQMLLALLLLTIFAGSLVLLPRGAAQLTGSDEGGAQFVPFSVIIRDLLNSFSVGVTASLDEAAWLDLMLLALWCLGVASTIRPARGDYRLALFLLTFALLPPIGLQLGSYLRPLYMNSRHLIAASPAFYIGIAFAVEALMGRARLPVLPSLRYAAAGIGAGSLLVLGSAFSLDNLYFNPTYAKDDHRAWADFLRAEARPGDLVVLNAPQAETIFRYYAPPGIEWVSLPNIGLSLAEQERLDFAAVRDAFAGHDRIWYLEIHRPVADSTNHIYNLLDRRGIWINLTRFRGLSTEIVLSEIVGSAAIKSNVEYRPPLATFGSNLELVGLNSPETIAAGTRNGVKLVWRLARLSGEDYGVSLRLVDDTGTRWGQWDALPLGNLFPTSKWQPGDEVVEDHLLPVEPGTPPGSYHLEISVYHAGNGEPLPIEASSGATVRLGKITVSRPAQPLDPRQLVFDHHLNTSLGPGLDLVGYDAEDSSAGPDDTIQMTLYFRLTAQVGGKTDGEIMVRPPPWMFWNRAQASAPFALRLDGRMPGDIVQTNVQLRLPSETSPGEYTYEARLSGNAIEIGTLNIK